jgi:energy-coupling factor transport system ATP-binding protein
VPLTLRNVAYTYAKGTSYAVPAIVDVSIEIEPGELILVLGSTGSGKSTLLKMAAGLLEPDRGEASIDGVVLAPSSSRGAVGLVFQDPESQLFADTVLDDVVFGPKNLGLNDATARKRAVKALVSVGLDPEEFGARSPFSLSGGEARRAAIAGVLAMEPTYLLADEPTAGLDSGGRRALKSLLLAVRKTTGVVIVSHSAEEFLGDADRVLLVAEGRTSFYGTADRLISNPSLFVDAGLIAPDVLEVQRLTARADGVPGGYTLDPYAAAEGLARLAGGVQ